MLFTTTAYVLIVALRIISDWNHCESIYGGKRRFKGVLLRFSVTANSSPAGRGGVERVPGFPGTAIVGEYEQGFGSLHGRLNART